MKNEIYIFQTFEMSIFVFVNANLEFIGSIVFKMYVKGQIDVIKK